MRTHRTVTGSFGKIFCCHGVAPGLVVIWMNVNSVHCFNTHCDSVDILHEECFDFANIIISSFIELVHFCLFIKGFPFDSYYNTRKYGNIIDKILAKSWVILTFRRKKMEEQKNTYEKCYARNRTSALISGLLRWIITLRFTGTGEMEILYILNGHATVHMEGEEYELNPLDAVVMDYARIHEVIYALPQTMGICIHVSRQLLRRYLPEAEPLRSAARDSVSVQGSRNITMKSAGI